MLKIFFRKQTLVLLLVLISSGVSVNALSAEKVANAFRYCVPVKSIDFNPYRKLEDGKELAYLFLFLRSYISTDPEFPGLLEAYEFSPDGTVFRGKISKTAVWSDGTPLTPKEAAMGIVKGFSYRLIGGRVHVVSQGQENEGIKVLDSRTFELHFSSKIENLTGVIREALSTGSRHNRVWPVRLPQKPGDPKFIAKYPHRLVDGHYVFDVSGTKVSLVSSSQCKSAEFSLYPEPLEADVSKYEVALSQRPQAIFAMINSSMMGLDSRSALTLWLRAAFKNLPEVTGVKSSISFFSVGEPGYSEGLSWDKKLAFEKAPALPKRLRVGVELPVFREAILHQAKRTGVDVEIVDFPIKDMNLDAVVVSSGVQEGRLIALQDVLKFNFSRNAFEKTKKTRDMLELIESKSASTLPPDNKTLNSFEDAALKERSIVPIARRFIPALSLKDAPLRLRWSHSGEPYFAKKGDH